MKLTCKRCGYSWHNRLYTENGSPLKPVACANPKCRSPYWDRDKKVKKEGEK